MTTGAPGFATRPASHRAATEERVEARNEVERVVVVRERLHLANAEVGLGKTLARELDQRLRGVDPVRQATAVCDKSRESMATLRGDIEDLRHRLDDAERTANELPHRAKYLLLVVGFLRGLLDLHEELVDQVDREFHAPAETGGKRPTR
jgi:hypothetical protein